MRQLLLVSLIALGACAEGKDVFRSTPTYYPTAEQNYERGLKELKGGNYLSAQQYFQHVKSNFSFSKWATLAELGVADCDVGRERYVEAIDEYHQFTKAHPFHERVLDGYVAYKVGEAHHKQIPSDWFLSPPSYEKDQGPVLDALRELETFSERFSDSPYAQKAEVLKADCIRRLSDHELYVANFYLKSNRPQAAIGRLEGLLRAYPGANREPETLLLLGKTYLKMEKPVEARAVFTRLAEEHPNDYRAEKARRFVQFIDKRYLKKDPK
jgi:outer membrane protein assembly factor BamD